MVGAGLGDYYSRPKSREAFVGNGVDTYEESDRWEDLL